MTPIARFVHFKQKSATSTDNKPASRERLARSTNRALPHPLHSRLRTLGALARQADQNSMSSLRMRSTSHRAQSRTTSPDRYSLKVVESARYTRFQPAKQTVNAIINVQSTTHGPVQTTTGQVTPAASLLKSTSIIRPPPARTRPSRINQTDFRFNYSPARRCLTTSHSPSPLPRSA